MENQNKTVNNTSTENQSLDNKKQMDPKKVKKIKIISGFVGILILLLIMIFVAKPARYVSCITFLGNDIIAYYDSDGNLKLPSDKEINRVGYTFSGWFENKSFTVAYDEDSFTGRKLYAKYERIVYTIEYLDSSSYSFETEYIHANGVQVWNPNSFFVKYNEKIVSDSLATAAWGKLIGTETDRVGIVYILNPSKSSSTFVEWRVYKSSDTELSNPIATLKPVAEGYSSLQKDIIIDTNETGIILEAVFE